jgi:microsomal epoxide hydrolase
MTISLARPFRASFDANAIADLRDRISRTRWTDQIPGTTWEYGTDRTYLKELCDYWRDGFDFQAAEDRINAFPHFLTEIDGQKLHFYHIRSPEPSAIPLLLLHGWPGCIAEFFDMFGPLTDPVRYGGQAEDAFHVIAPSLPGFAFSGPTAETGFGPERMGKVFGRLMEGLGYPVYGIQGGDWGAVIATLMGSLVPDKLIGIHLNLMMGSLMATPPDPDDLMRGLTPREQQDVLDSIQFRTTENGYQIIQSTKPQTVGYGLNDSPAGLAGWIIEKYRGWSDCEGNIENSYSKDQLLTILSIYWFTETINSSMRIYHEFTGFGRAVRLNGASGTPAPIVPVPVAHARYPKEVVKPPRSWAEKQYPNIVRWTEMEKGGHFAALEVPESLIPDVRAFFRALPRTTSR